MATQTFSTATKETEAQILLNSIEFLQQAKTELEHIEIPKGGKLSELGEEAHLYSQKFAGYFANAHTKIEQGAIIKIRSAEVVGHDSAPNSIISRLNSIAHFLNKKKEKCINDVQFKGAFNYVRDAKWAIGQIGNMEEAIESIAKKVARSTTPKKTATPKKSKSWWQFWK